MNNLFILLFFILGFSWAQAKDYSSAPERGVLIGIVPDKKAIKSTEGVKFSGVIKVVNKDKDEDHEKDHDKKTLLQEFQKEGLDIVGTFPSEAIDISNNLEITSTNEKEIRFSFTVNNINANDLNQFSVKVFNNHKNKELLARLAQIKAKIEKRILALHQLKNKSKKENWSEKAIEYINKKSEVLNQLSQQIASNINSNESLLAQNTYALQVDNLTSSESQISLIMNKYRFMVSSEIGTTIEGMSTKITASVLNLRKTEEKEDDDDDDKDDYKAAQFLFNGVALYTSAAQSLKNGESISYTYTTDRLLPVNGNEFSVALYHVEENKLKKRIGWVTQKIPVVPDIVKPMWLTSSSPSSANGTLYVQALDYVNLHAQDEFGRIDTASFKAVVSGSLASSESFNQDVSSKFSKLKIGDGWEYAFSADVNPLAEGLYNLEANIKDLALNAAETKTINFRIDRTSPSIAISVPADALTNQLTYQVPVKIDDLSPTTTKVYVNEELQLTTESTFFTATLNLTLEGANLVKVVSQDRAGNVAVSEVKTIVRDTTPPILSNLLPASNSTIAKIKFDVSGSSNEPLSEITVNGMALVLSINKMTFSGRYISAIQGENELIFVAKDLVGNITTVKSRVNLSDRLLVKELVTIIPDSDNRHYKVTGKAGAARAGASISVSAGLLSLNRGSDVASLSGTFSVRLDKFTKVTVKAKDIETNEEDSFELNFNVPTQIAGMIKDTDDAPLPGATVRILGTSIAVVSDASGVFSIQDAPIGDQTMSIDGSTIVQSSTGPSRKFSVYNLAVSVSAGQVNTFSRPIYLTATLLDGTGTTVTNNAAANVTDSNAPGVIISVPANGAVFPDGSNTGHISMKNIPAAKTLIPVPSHVVPDEVIALEPSGLRFKDPVEITIPNVNELNEGTEVFIFSLNSKSGQWEIDGVGKVEVGGQTIKTKQGEGITHFSEVFAVPTVPYIASVQDPNLQGISTSVGVMETSVELPSYKSLGQKITPALRYNSSWANPTAFVSNIFDVPKYEIKFKRTNNEQSSQIVEVPKYCTRGVANRLYCSNEVLIEQYYNETFNFESSYYVNQLSAQSWVGINSTDNETFDTINNTQSPNDIPGPILQNTLKTNKWTLVNNEAGSLIPNMSQVSYEIPLKKADGSFLNSGIYPSFTRFQIKLKHLTMTTRFTSQKTIIRDIGGNLNQVNDPNYTFQRTETNLNTYYIDSIAPKDLNRDILVQNKVNSAVGRGWEFNPTQKLINTKGSKILVEEAGGTISTYTSSYPIETIFNANGTEIDFSKGGGLSSWPHLYASTYGADKIGRVVKVNLENSQINQISQLETISGSTGFDKIDECQSGAIKPFIRKYKFNFKHKPSISNVVEFPDGRRIATNTATHSIIDITNPISYTLGGNRISPSFSLNTRGAGHEQRYQTLCESLNLDCDPLVDLNSTQTCDSQLQNHDESGELAQAKSASPIAPIGSNDFSNGLINASGSFGTENFRDVGFNNPTGLVISPDGKLVVADTGSNVVYKVNTITGKLNILAGDYGTTDRGDGGYAAPQVIYDVVKYDSLKEIFIDRLIPKAYAVSGTGISSFSQASIYHPKGLAYDSNGNLYITSENGYVRKVDANGIISTYAGKKLEDGGVFAADIHAELMIFNNPTGIVIDSEKNMMYVADTGNHRIIQINMQSKIANTVAGNNTCDLDPKDGGSSLNSSICAPTWLGFDNNKNLLVLDSGHQRVRRIRLNKSTSPNLTYLPSNKDLSTLDKLPDGTFIRKFRDGTQSFFNVKGQEVSSVDRVGRTVSYTYNFYTDKLTKITDATGQVSEFVYSGDKLQYFIDPAGRKTYFTYEGNNLSSIIFPDNSSKKFSYDAAGRMLVEENERGNKKQYQYNEVGRLASIIDENAVLTTANDKVSQTLNSPKREGLEAGKVNSSVVLPNNTEIKITNDANGFIRKIRDTMGRDTEIVSDFEGKVLEIKRGADQHISMKYDANTKDLLESKNEISGLKSSSVYNQYGQQISKTDFNNNVITRNYADTTGILISEIHPDNVTVGYSYNSYGLPINKTLYPSGNSASSLTTQYEYDNLGNQTKIIGPDGKYIVNTFDRAGNILTSTAFTDAGIAATTTYEYDSRNRLTKVFSPKSEVTQYRYFATGELVEIIDPKEKSTVFQYDKKGQLLGKISPEGVLYQFEYDSMGNLKKEIDPNGSVKEYTYLPNNKVKTVTMADDVIEYRYDSKDLISSVLSNSGIIAYVRDVNDRVTIETSYRSDIAKSYSNAMLYDDNGNLTSMQTSTSDYQAAITLPPLGTTLQAFNYSYDANDRLVSMSNYWGDQFNFGYDQANRLISMTRPGSKTDYVYNSGSNLAQIIHSASNITKAFVEFTYDNRNFVTQKRQPASTFNYKYDSNGQLLESDKSENPAEKEIFNYDSLGNRTTGTYDQSGQRIQDDGLYTYLYDNNGNILSKSSKAQGVSYAFEYTSRNQMKKAYVLNAPLTAPIKTISYQYDPIGRRVQKSVIDQLDNSKSYIRKYIYSGDNIVAEIDGANRMLASFTHSPLNPDDLLGVHFTNHAVQNVNGGDALNEAYVLSQAQGNFYYLKDHLNTVTDIIDGQGAIVQSYDYSSFGVLRGIKNSSGTEVGFANAPIRTHFTFTSREHEQETGLYYYRARYYDPSVGRFLQQDPDPGRLRQPITVVNKYSYVGNNPILYNDPSGRFFGIVEFIIWAVGSVVIGLIDNNINGGNFLTSLIKGMIVATILYATWYATPDSFMFDLANGISAQAANYAINVGSIALISGGQSGNTFNNFTRNVMNGDSLFALGAQWMGYGFQVDNISGVGEIGAYLISATANFMAYIPTIDSYCHPRESNGGFVIDSDGKRVNRCE